MNKNERNNTITTNYVPAVNSHDYWIFRKRNEVTPADFAITDISEKIGKKKSVSFDDAKAMVLNTYDTIAAVNDDAGSNNRVMLQYINQLTEKGFNRMINGIREQVEKNYAKKN